MKVKIGDKVYDSRIEPIMIIMEDNDKKNIANMLPEATKFASFPNTSDKDKISKWMDTP